MSEIKTRLLPCPFCGEEKVRVACPRGQKAWLECECGLETKVFESKEEAIKHWNTRKPMERIEKKIGDLMPFLTAQEVYVSKNEVLKIVKEEGGIE